MRTKKVQQSATEDRTAAKLKQNKDAKVDQSHAQSHQTNTWGWVKTLVPSEHQNSWKMDVHPTKSGINRY